MINCDHCPMWYHGRCVGVKEGDWSNMNWICPSCCKAQAECQKQMKRCAELTEQNHNILKPIIGTVETSYTLLKQQENNFEALENKSREIEILKERCENQTAIINELKESCDKEIKNNEQWGKKYESEAAIKIEWKNKHKEQMAINEELQVKIKKWKEKYENQLRINKELQDKFNKRQVTVLSSAVKGEKNPTSTENTKKVTIVKRKHDMSQGNRSDPHNSDEDFDVKSQKKFKNQRLSL
ncbi:uncharacterized protein LOC127750106 [Frankliniella occidentalis]|uniref:Uncharacterized protein LOC127750106 n=1 Tax=Frankliniella occidentalis TaxID=133901 RepID=A0A9C6U5G7_FRAOC|nr:uncharacterized protein LOC127750106 [Frankliniella occidentalis]